MKKTIIVLMMALLAITSSFAAFVEIGDGTETTNYVPLYGYYDYSWSTFVLTADQIGQSLSISGIEFDVSNDCNNYQSLTQKVYVKAVTTDSVTVAYPFPEMYDYTLVFEGDVVWDGSGWQGVTFDTPFEYDGTSNLEILWENRDASYASGYPVFKKTATDNSRSAYKYQDSSFPEAVGTLQSFHPNTRLVYTVENEPVAASLATPVNFSAENAIAGSLTWTNNDYTTSVDVYLSANEEDVVNNEASAKVVDDQLVESYDFNLEYATTYFWKVVANNNVSNLTATSSVWSFTTEVGEITLPVTYDFEEVASSQLPLGWASVKNSTSTSAEVGVSTSAGYESSNGVKLYNVGDEEAELLAVTPLLDGTDARVIFMAKTTSTADGNQIILGTISDVADASTFTAIETIDITNEWAEYTVALTAGESRYAFKHGVNGTYRSIYIDNVLFEEIPANEPVAATLTAPVNGTIIDGLATSLEWTLNENTTNVDVYFSNNAADVEANVESAKVVDSQNVTTYEVADLDNLSTYFWKVVAKNDDNYAVDSEVFSFATQPGEGSVLTGLGQDVDTKLPMDPFFDYNYSQVIYPADQIGTAGTIEAIAYQYNGNSALAPEIDIYIGTTDLNEFAEASSWIDANSLTLSYSGTFTAPAAEGWVNVTLDTPFEYNGSSNLVVAFDENTDGYSLSADEFFAYASEVNSSLVKSVDNTDVDPFAPVDGVLKAFIPNTVFTFGSAVTPLPVVTDLAATVNESDVVLTWTAPVSDEYTVTEYNLFKDGADLATVTELTYTDADLADGTYEYTVKAVYAEGTSAASNVATATVVTGGNELAAPTNLAAVVDGANVTLTWEAPVTGGDEPAGLTESFEGEFPPAGWEVNSTNETTWEQIENYDLMGMGILITEPTDGTHQACLDYVESGAQDEWLITPAISNPVTLSFDLHGGYDPADVENYKVKVSTDNGTTWTEVWHPVADETYDYTAPVTIDLSAYTGDVKVAWHCAQTTGLASTTLIDNVIISTARRTRDLTGYEIYRDNALVTTVTALTYIDADLADGTYEYTVKAVYDEGTSPASNVATATVEVDPIEVDAPVNLTASVNEADVTLNWLAPGTEIPEGTTESFENAFPPTDWTINNTNTTATWEQVETVSFSDGDVVPTEGSFQAKCGWDYSAQDEWLITNELTAPEGNLTFDFYGHNGSTYGDNYFVKISTDAGSTWTALWNATDLPEADNHYDTPISIDLSAYAGQSVKIAWQCVDGDGAGLWYTTFIDNVNIGGRALRSSEVTAVSKAVNAPSVNNVVATSNQSLKRDANEASYIPMTSVAKASLVTRDVTAYVIYKDGVNIAEVDATTLTYTDADLENGTYEYYVTAMYDTQESEASNTVSATVNVVSGDALLSVDFESFDDFSLEMGSLTLVDNDLNATYGFQGTTFPHTGEMMSYIVFNPSSTEPAIEGDSFTPNSGDKYAACFAAMSPSTQNDDWMMTPVIELADAGTFSFMAKSQTTDYGAERFNVLVSDGSTNPDDFTSISGATYTEAPLNWTSFSYDLSAYANSSIRIAIQCVSNDAFIFMVDDLTVVAPNGTPNTGDQAPIYTTNLNSNYPNPFNPETTISYSVEKAGKVSIDVYNILGQKVKTLVNDVKSQGNHTVVWNGQNDNNRNVASGVYFYKMRSGKFSKTKKMILMK